MFRRDRFRSDSVVGGSGPGQDAARPMMQGLNTGDGDDDGRISLEISRPSVRMSRSTTSAFSLPLRMRTSSTIALDVLDPLGLQAVHVVDQPRGHLVFVHGLGGSAWKTWCWNRDLNNCWLPWLADDQGLRHFQISTFGYNARIGGASTNLDIIDFAKDLLFQLAMKVGSEAEVRETPIIFVVHSMGGLVVKKAYTLGKNDGQYSTLIRHVRGMIFLATPHRGSQYVKILSNILSTASFGSSAKSYLSGLDMQSSTIQDINEGFRQHCDGLLLCSFYETLQTSIGFTKALIVGKDSAVLGYPSELSVAMDADHHNVCKYQSQDDPNFGKIRGVLRNWANQLPTATEAPQQPVQTRRQTYEVSENQLNVDDQISEILGIHILENKPDTPALRVRIGPFTAGNWLFRSSRFREWLPMSPHSPSVFLLVGLPGTGKTVLSTSAAAHLASLGFNVQSRFFSQSDQHDRTVTQSIRSLAFQLAGVEPKFRDALLQLKDSTGIDFRSRSQTLGSLWERLVEGLMFKMEFTKPLAWIFDSIDEADSATSLLRRLTSMDPTRKVKIFCTSRPMKGVSSSDLGNTSVFPVSIEDTRSDMKDYVFRAVKQLLPHDQDLQTYVGDEILRRASGSFLWAQLALEAIQDRWHTEADVKTALTEVPEGMSAMYEQMVASIEQQSPRNQLLARRVLTWIICSSRPLFLGEVAEALEVEFGALTNLEITIHQICGHFLTVEKSGSDKPRVSLIHATAREFLLCGTDTRPGWIDKSAAHEMIARTCLNLLSIDKWRIEQLEMWEGIRQASSNKPNSELRGRYRMVQALSAGLHLYAAENWAYHVAKASPDSSELMETLEMFLTSYSLAGIEFCAICGKMGTLIAAAQSIKALLKRTRRRPSEASPPMSKQSLQRNWPIASSDWLRPWAADFIRIAGKFASNLSSSPSSVYRNVPAICPSKSMIGKIFGQPRPGALSVSGLTNEVWDDCISTVVVGNDQWVNQVLATDRFFFTLSSSAGTIYIWDADTCERRTTLVANEYVPMMATNATGTLVIGVGTVEFHVWATPSGILARTIAKSTEAMVRAVSLDSTGNRLFVVYETCYYEILEPQTGAIMVSAQPDDAITGVAQFGCPWRQSVSPDFKRVALAWRGQAPLVLDFRPNGNATRVRCPVRSSSDPLLYPEKLVWIAGTRSLMILCADTSLFQWSVSDSEVLDYPHVKASNMTPSNDGSLLLTSDNAGTLSVWALPRLSLLYSIANTGDPSNDMVFGPCSQRFYDVRNSSCHVWEPDALVRSDDVDFEDGSSATGSYATTEPCLATSSAAAGRATVTALALCSLEGYFSCGRDDGTVVIHEDRKGDRSRKVLTHSGIASVVALGWSATGRYMASCDDASAAICKGLQLKADGKWAVFPVFETRLAGAVLQVLFSIDEKHVMLGTSSEGQVWDLRSKQFLQVVALGPSTHWTLSPADPEQVLAISAGKYQIMHWSTGSFVRHATLDFTVAHPPGCEAGHHEHGNGWASAPTIEDDSSTGAIWSSSFDDGERLLIATGFSDNGHTVNHCGNLQLWVCGTMQQESLQSPRRIPQIVADRVKIILGMCRWHLVFLDFGGWVVSYDLSAFLGDGLSTGGDSIGTHHEDTRRHFFLPKDWLSTTTAHLARLGGDGILLFPKGGDVAIVRNGVGL